MALQVIEWRESATDEIVRRFEPGGEFILGSQLIVQENQWAVFFRDGKALDVFSAGRYTLTTLNLPLITSIVKIPFDKKTPFRADAYFISRRAFINLKWGTKEPVAFRDSEFGMVRLRAFGLFSVRISEPQLFLNTLVGTQGVYTTFNIEDFIRGVVVGRLNDVLGETTKTLLDLPRNYDELAEALKTRVKADLEKYGIALSDFLINAITPPEEVQKKIDERGGMAVIGDMGRYAQYQSAQAIRDAAQNPEGGAAGAGLGAGVGIGLGLSAAQTMGQALTAAQGAQTQCPSCKMGIPQNSKFCPQCGVALSALSRCQKCNAEIPHGAKFCPGCGNKI